MNRANVGKPAAGIDHGKGRARLPTEEEQASRFFGGVGLLLLVRVDVIENGFSGGCHINHKVNRIHRGIRVNIAVVGQQRSDVFQRHGRIISPPVQRKDKLPKAYKRWMVDNVADGTAGF